MDKLIEARALLERAAELIGEADVWPYLAAEALDLAGAMDAAASTYE